MSKYVKIINENDDVVDKMHCLHESVAEHALCKLLNYGSDVYMQDVSGFGTMLVSDIKDADHDPKKKQAEIVGHIPFFVDKSGQFILSDSPDFKEAVAELTSQIREHAVGSIYSISSATHNHPYVPGGQVLLVTAIADDFDFEKDQVIELDRSDQPIINPM